MSQSTIQPLLVFASGRGRALNGNARLYRADNQIFRAPAQSWLVEAAERDRRHPSPAHPRRRVLRLSFHCKACRQDGSGARPQRLPMTRFFHRPTGRNRRKRSCSARPSASAPNFRNQHATSDEKSWSGRASRITAFCADLK